MKIIDRYIIKELIPPFLLGILLFTFVLLINRIFKLTELIVNKGVSLFDALRLFSYIMPSLLTLTIPMAVLLAALVAFGRLSTDSEVVALKATGFSLPRLVAPVMAFSLAALLLTGYFSLYLGPAKARDFKRDIFFLAKSRAATGIDEGIFNDSFKDVVIYAQKTPAPNEMEGVFISDERSPDESYVIIARKGLLDVDPATGYAFLDLTQGSIHKKGTKASSYQEITFASNTLSINLYEKFFKGDEVKKGKREMSLGELRSIAEELRDEGTDSYPILTEYYNRFSIPLACLIFGMVGPPLGLFTRRSGRSAGMTVAVAVFAVYYLLMKGGENLAAGGHVHPLLAVLIPNAVIGGFGAFLLVKCSRESEFGLGALMRLAAGLSGPLKGGRGGRRRRG